MQSFEVFWESRNPLNRLYHYTTLQNLVHIIKDNRFLLTYIGTSSHEQFRMKQRFKKEDLIGSQGRYKQHDTGIPSYKKNFFMSASRSLMTKYSPLHSFNLHKDTQWFPTTAFLELDESKLSDRYEVMPVNYYFRNAIGLKEIGENDEMENRIFSNKPMIGNAKKYIVAVHMYVNPKTLNEADGKKYIDYLKTCGVKVYEYKKPVDLAMLRRERAEVFQGKGAPYFRDNVYQNSPAVKDYLHYMYDFIHHPSLDMYNYIQSEYKAYETQGLDDTLMVNRSSPDIAMKHLLHQFSELQRKTGERPSQLYFKAKQKIGIN